LRVREVAEVVCVGVLVVIPRGLVGGFEATGGVMGFGVRSLMVPGRRNVDSAAYNNISWISCCATPVYSLHWYSHLLFWWKHFESVSPSLLLGSKLVLKQSRWIEGVVWCWWDLKSS
jgi:hypothetical protein